MESWDTTLCSMTDFPDDVGFATFLWDTYKNKQFVDGFFVLENESSPVFSAHKLVLSLWSPYFADKFYGPEKKDNKVPLKDVNLEAFEDMLKFMYGCEPILNTCSKASELFKVAVKFQVTYLADICQKFLTNVDIQVGNVFDILETSKHMQNQSLMDRCLKLVQVDTKSIIDHYKLTDISPSKMKIILCSPKLSLDSEFELLLWIFKWGNQCVENKQHSSVRKALEDFLPQLHFLALTNYQFAMLNRDQKSFFSTDEVCQILMNIAICNSWPKPYWYDAKAEFREYTGNKKDEQASLN